MLTISLSYRLQSGNGNLHMWNTTYHCLPPPAYTIQAIANPTMPQGMSPGEFLRDLKIRSPTAMYRDLGQPDALEKYGRELMDIMYQILDRIQGAMAELRNQQEAKHKN